MEVFASQILTEELDIFGEVDVQDAAKVLGSAFDVIGARQKNIMRCPMQVVLYPVFSFQHYALPLRLPQKPLVVRNEKGTSVISLVRNVTRVVQYNVRGHFALCRLRRTGCDPEEVAYSMLEGRSWYFYGKKIWAGYCSWLPL